jgi:hypothetical protein
MKIIKQVEYSSDKLIDVLAYKLRSLFVIIDLFIHSSHLMALIHLAFLPYVVELFFFFSFTKLRSTPTFSFLFDSKSKPYFLPNLS